MAADSLTRLSPVVLSACFLVIAMPAAGQSSSSHLTVEAGGGYAANPFLVDGDGTGSALGRASAFAVHSRQTERSALRVSAFGENATYARRYGSKQIFDLDGHAELQTSERVRLLADAGFTGDIAGQLSGRVSGTPSPEVPDPTLPPPLTTEPDVFGLTARQYRARGQIGAVVTASETSSINMAIGAQHVFFSGEFEGAAYTVYTASGGYDRKLSERTTVGGRLSLQRADYSGSDNRSTILNPQLTMRRRLSESWEMTAAAGLLMAEHKSSGGSGRSTSLSLDGTLCRTEGGDRLCARASRYAQPAANANLVTTTSAGVDFRKQLDAKQAIDAWVTLLHYSGEEGPARTRQTTYAVAAGNYSRKVSDRLSAGASVGVRNLAVAGPDPRTDVNGSLFLRYRVGDLHD